MSIEDADVVDFISVGASGAAELTISDHLDWEDTERHIELLQYKIYRYLDFIESGELYQSNPAAAGETGIGCDVWLPQLAQKRTKAHQECRRMTRS